MEAPVRRVERGERRSTDRLAAKEIPVNEATLPKSILGRAERRWAARLTRDAKTWRSEKPHLGNQTAVVDRAGRVVPVTIKRAPNPLRALP